ncbi:hypothetical protein A2U01_0117958, partial [Trifolium medium]|nr:hypothetical protein [Trifolium medium]
MARRAIPGCATRNCRENSSYCLMNGATRHRPLRDAQ